MRIENDHGARHLRELPQAELSFPLGWLHINDVTYGKRLRQALACPARAVGWEDTDYPLALDLSAGELARLDAHAGLLIIDIKDNGETPWLNVIVERLCRQRRAPVA